MTFDSHTPRSPITRCALAYVLLALLMLPQAAFASPGGRAQLGDDCTDFRTYAIGYALGDWVQDQPTIPSGSARPDRTIVDQRTIFSVKMSGGKPEVVTPVGWELVVGNGETYFLASGGPPQLFIEPSGANAQSLTAFYIGVFRDLGNHAAYGAALIDSLSKYGASPVACYSRPLRAPASPPSPNRS